MEKDFKTILNQHCFIDKSDIVKKIIDDRENWCCIVSNDTAVKTALLSMLYYFLEITESSYDLFKDKKISEWDKWLEHLNKYIVLPIDFSGFHAETYEEALNQIYHIMKNVYMQKMKYLFDTQQMDTFQKERLLDFTAHQPDEKELSYSLREILYCCSHVHFFMHEERMRPCILIDNLVMVEKEAEEYGYNDGCRKPQ